MYRICGIEIWVGIREFIWHAVSAQNIAVDSYLDQCKLAIYFGMGRGSRGLLYFPYHIHQFDLYHTLEVARNMDSLVEIEIVTKYVKKKTTATKKGSEREKLKN